MHGQFAQQILWNQVYMTCFRCPSHSTDVLVTYYRPEQAHQRGDAHQTTEPDLAILHSLHVQDWGFIDDAQQSEN